MAFDLERWKERLEGPLRDFTQDPSGALKRAGAHTLFAYLVGMTLFPLAEAAAKGELTSVLLTLGGVAGGIGVNLVANKVQRWKDEATFEFNLEANLIGLQDQLRSQNYRPRPYHRGRCAPRKGGPRWQPNLADGPTRRSRALTVIG